MPNEVIAQIHRLAAAAEKYDGVVFTDIQGNVLAEQLDEEEDRMNNEHTIAFEGNVGKEATQRSNTIMMMRMSTTTEIWAQE